MKASSREESLAIFQDSSAFSKQLCNYLYEQTDNDGHVRIHRDSISFAQIQRIFNSSKGQNVEGGLRVLSIPRPKLSDKIRGRGYYLGISKVAVDFIVDLWQLHPFTLEALLYNNGIFVEFYEATKHYLVIKVPHLSTVGYDFVSISHDCVTGTTNVLYHGLSDEAGLFDHIEDSRRECNNPKFFTLALYRSHQLQVERKRFEINKAVLDTEAANGFGCPSRLLPFLNSCRVALGRSEKVDYDNIVRGLSFCQTELAVTGNVAKFSLDLGNWLAEGLRQPRSQCHIQNETGVKDCYNNCQNIYADAHRCDLVDSMGGIFQNVEYVRCRAMTTVSQIQAMNSRAQSQTSPVSSLSLHQSQAF
jgi:hypothetical protein